ncbi:hypothetical protein DOTSEDRAFT_75153 [Dothistroma septosporum NZE10]|uniref:AAA+ ATPase domain-containing protein n=1 Tax=Dothistroma septosporum (strain NZE10 / CBS 128990) TaxID=675120 RepID=M2XIS3_DOTSN|nr:hypothetical protein DOTSEDRAFT_75153 [Dothistroma septosporum NZE10]
MAASALLQPTLHVEVLLKNRGRCVNAHDICREITEALANNYVELQVGQDISLDRLDTGSTVNVESVVVSDYTGGGIWEGCHDLEHTQLDVQAYVLKADHSPSARQPLHEDDEDDVPKARMVALPNITLRDCWSTLVYEDHLPAQLLRYLTRMLGLMKQPGLNLSTFNWNRLCLLHGPPGSGKSTLCRALAQKLSIRLSNVFPSAILVEVNTNAMLSKYFGESGKKIGALFEVIYQMAQSCKTLVCVVMDEVETIAGSRERAASGGECSDGLRATNQLLTALDRLRALPNIIVLCTSNLIDAIDPAFLDRVDIKQLIPCPSPAAIYDIFRSCLNELVRASLIDTTTLPVASQPLAASASSPTKPAKRRAVRRSNTDLQSMDGPATSSPERWQLISAPSVPPYAEMMVHYNKPQSAGPRVWALAQKCEGLSGRTLRRLPVLGLAMYTWGGNCSLENAVSALEQAVNQELLAKQMKES